MKPTPAWIPHDDCGCDRAPLVGSRYRRRVRDIMTGDVGDWRYFTVVSVEPIRHDRIFCRRITLVGDDGWVGHPQVQQFFESGYEAIENVVNIAIREPK